MKRVVVLMVSMVLTMACERQEQSPAASATQPEPGAVAPPAETLSRNFSLESLTRGAAVFQEHCAECHGPQAQGHPGWEEGVSSDVVMAPPLDGSAGGLWKRSKTEIIRIIQQGVRRDQTLVMPAWRGRLSDQEIEDTITWMQALWPAEVYERWQKANATQTASPSQGS